MTIDYTSGAGPEQLKRLFAEALDESDQGEDLSASSPLDLFLEKPGSQVGRYKLLSILGEGGMGVVFLAQQERPIQRQVALKVIKPGMDSKRVIARFRTERQTLALLDHPNIARVIDAGATATGRPYFVMEYVRGLPITQYCDNQQLTIEERLNLFFKVCQAVQHAHQKGIIHRDLKPSNILVTLQDGLALPKVIDFGVARAMGSSLTEHTLSTEQGQLVGTPVYMSPEQAKLIDLDVDTRTDIYSLGVLLYELLTGTPPFSEEQLREAGYLELQRIIRDQEPTRPSGKLSVLGTSTANIAAQRQTSPDALRKSVRGDLDWIVMKCLEKDRTRRYETAHSLAGDLQRHLDHEPIVARPPSTAYRLQKAWRRNKVAFTAVAVAAITLLSGTVISAWQAHVANTARARAEVEERRAREGERRQRLIAYASDMKAAQIDLGENNLTRVVGLLNRYVPKPGEEDLRGIAWRYLWQACQGDEIYTFPHESMVTSISLSNDGARLASASMNGTVWLFDVPSRRRLQEHKGGLISGGAQNGRVALSPDGQLLAADQQGTLRVWNADSNALIFEQKHVVSPVCFSPDSRFLAAVTAGGLCVWSIADWTSRLMGPSLAIETHYQRSLTFTPDGRRVVFCPDRHGNKLTVWNLTDDTLEGELTGLDMPVSISTDGSIVAVGGWGGEVCLWDLASRMVIKKFRAHNGLVLGVALSPDGKTLATGGNDQVIRLWDTQTFENTRSLKGHHSEIWDLDFSPNGRVLASASKDRSVRLWDWTAQPDTESEYSVPKNLYCRGFSKSADVLRFYDPTEWPEFSESGDILPPERRGPGAATPHAKTEHLLNIATGQWTHVVRADSEMIAHTTSMTWESGQDTEVFGREDGTVVLSNGTTTRSIQVANHPVQPLLLSPQERYLLLNVLPTNAESYAILWNIEAEEVVGTFPKILKGRFPMKQAISPDERFLAYNGDEYTIKLWCIPEAREWATLRGHTWHLFGAEFSPDSRLLASFGWDADCRLWDVEQGIPASPHLLRGHRSGVDQAIFSPDARTLVTSSDDSTCKLWSVATGQELLSFPSPRVFPLVQRLPMMAKKADRLVWGGDSNKSWDTAAEVPLRVTTLPSLAEIDQEIERRARVESQP